MRQFGRKGFYLKNAAVIEHLFHVDTIVFDKTGTITTGNYGGMNFVGESLSENDLLLIKSLAFHSSHPLSKLLASSVDYSDLYPVEDFREIPSMGITGMVDGVKINLGSSYFVTGRQQGKESQGSEVWVSLQNSLRGYFRIGNEYRAGLSKLVEGLKATYELHLLTGDNDAEKSKLRHIFGNESHLHFSQSPTDKLNYIRKMQEVGKKVLMIGDGLNDAGALKESYVGIVIADNVFNFSPACDAILQASQFYNLLKFINFTKRSMKIAWMGFGISFLYNIVGLSFAVQGNLTPIVAAILMPISSVSVVAFASFYVSLSAKRFRL
jgi:Cu+-exporting ATPase